MRRPLALDIFGVGMDSGGMRGSSVGVEDGVGWRYCISCASCAWRALMALVVISSSHISSSMAVLGSSCGGEFC